MSQIQAKFFTRQAEFSVPVEPISLDGTTTPEQLNVLINSLLERGDGEHVEFEFLTGEEIIRSTLCEHLEDAGIPIENIVEVEYAEKCPAPEPIDSLLHNDWVSGVHCAKVHDRELILTGSYDCTVTIWTMNGKKLITLPGHSSPVKAVKWVSSDATCASFISTSHDETAILWKWNHQKNIVEAMVVCKGHERSVDAVDVDVSNNRFATGGYDNVIKLWSTSTDDTELDVKKDSDAKKAKSETRLVTRTPLVSLASHTEAITGIQLCEEKEMISCSMDNTLKVWDLEVGGFSNNLLGSKAFLDLSYSYLNRTVVTASADRHVRLWDPRSKDGAVVKGNYSSHSGWVSAVHWSPTFDNQFISASYDGVLKLWDTRSCRASLYDMEGHEERLLCCDWSLPAWMVSGAADNKLKVFKHTLNAGG